MRHPAVLRRTVPVLDLRRYVHDHARLELDGRLAPLLIPTATAYGNQNLTCAVMHVPVIAAARLERDIVDAHALCRQLRQVALPDKILPERVRLTNRERHTRT